VEFDWGGVCANTVSIFTDMMYCSMEDESNSCVLVSNANLKEVKRGR